MATVGYGDTYPVTTQGRIVGTALMIMGVALLGTITASIASNFNLTNSQDFARVSNSPSLDKVHAELDALKKRMAELESQLKN